MLIFIIFIRGKIFYNTGRMELRLYSGLFSAQVWDVLFFLLVCPINKKAEDASQLLESVKFCLR